MHALQPLPNETMSQTWSRYVLTTKFESLPSEVVEKTEQIILDTIGCMLEGSRDRAGAAAVLYGARFGHKGGKCSIFGRPELVDPEHASLANGTCAHVLELDDGHRPSDNHLGGVLVPAAVAVAQHIGASAKELLMAVTLGYDVMGRIGEAVMLPRISSMFHLTGTTGVFGSAAATGRLMGFSQEQLVNAFGIAGDGAAALKEFQTPPFTGMDTKPLHSGRAAQTGMTAAFMAAGGFEGPTTILEGPKGFCVVMTAQNRPHLICRDLGTRFAVIESGFKLHSCPGGACAIAVDAALELRKEHRIDHRKVTKIRIAIPAWTATPGFERLRHFLPDTSGRARFSYPFLVASALIDGEVTHLQLVPEKMKDPDILRLQGVTEFYDDPEVQAISDKLGREDPYYYAPARVEVHHDGAVHARLERTPLGYDSQRPLTREQVIDKFRRLVVDVLSKRKQDDLVEWAFGLHTKSKVDRLAAILA
jgi:2-methylcitrate dehydratase PrpD